MNAPANQSAQRKRALDALSRLRRFLKLKSHLARVGKREDNRGSALQRKAFFVLISTILSHRTRDEKTEVASDALLHAYPTPLRLAAAPPKAIERLIKPVGFYHSKAGYVKECSKELVERFGGKVPDSMDELTTLTGVGRKTAGCVLVYAFEKREGIPVDSHVHQVSNRLGIVSSKTPLETEMQLMELLPKSAWLDVNELFVVFGRTTCLPISPLCSKCPFNGTCPKIGVKARR